jgi:superfamily I DNA/RNA helicase
MQLPIASNEQRKVIEYIENNNVVVDSVAGSGKTTTILHIAKQIKNNILLLTYNSRLKTETRNKVALNGLTNIEVHSYHSFCYKHYTRACTTDTGISDIIKSKKDILNQNQYDMIILDEAQDITPLYYELIYKIMKDNNISPKLCIFGDRNQSIFDFNNADRRFIIYGKSLFNINNYAWQTTDLTTSFRLTKQNAEFLNKCVLGDNRIQTVKSGVKPRYIICDTFGKLGLLNNNERTYKEVLHYLKSYKYEDIFILAPSVKSDKAPVRQLANILTKHGIPIFVPNSDEDRLDDDIMKGKLFSQHFIKPRV